MKNATFGPGETGAAKGLVPGWVPAAALHYLDHTEAGMSIRAVARREGCAASTILRQIQRFERRRDDPLIDKALTRLGAARTGEEGAAMVDTAQPDPGKAPRIAPAPCDEETVMKEARRVLRRLAESGAVLAVAPQMEKAAVLRELPDGRSTRTAVVDRAVAEAFALKDWIALRRSGKVATYTLSKTGRNALRRLLEEPRPRALAEGFAESQQPFADQHRMWGSKHVEEDGRRRRMRYNMAESPVVALSRRREKDGTPFLTQDLVTAAERLREDFEVAQMGPRVAQDWDRFLTGGSRGGFQSGDVLRGPEGARARVAAALRDLGPGLGDMVLRCCCFLEGLEATEKRMGWSARSGKIVLRIALQRLKRHYDDTYGPGGGLIG